LSSRGSTSRAGVSTSVPDNTGTGCCGVAGPVPQPLWIRCLPDCDEMNLQRSVIRRQAAARADQRRCLAGAPPTLPTVPGARRPRRAQPGRRSILP
jgi:hypothetical protein